MVAVRQDRVAASTSLGQGRVECPSRDGFAVADPGDGAVVDHERERIGQFAHRRQGEGIAPSGDDGQVHAAGGGGVERLEVGRRNPAVAVDERAVDVDGDQADHPIRFRNAS